MKRISTGFLPPVALDMAGSTPMYDQLSEWFRRAILEGRLRPGQRVPSTRSLAKELRISRVPVLSAYEQLYAEGYLETFVGAGTCVARAIPGKAAKPNDTRERHDPVPSATPRTVAQRVADLRVPPQTWANTQGAFRVGLPAIDHFPITTWSKLINHHARKPPMELMVYGEPMGYLPLREAIAEYLGTVRTVRCDASQILITTGSQHGLQICIHALINTGDSVWMEDPGYPGARQALRTLGADIVPVPVDDEGLDVEAGIRLNRHARAAYISPSHQFPLGVTMSAARRMQLLSWASNSGAWIIEDDYDSEYRFGGRPLASLQGMDTEGRVVYVGTFSKVMFPALRVGYLVVPKDLVPAFAAVRDAFDTFSSTLYQVVLTDFIREGHFARHIRRMRTLYLERRNALLEAIDTYMGDKLEVIGTQAGMQLAALLPPGVNDVALSIEAAKLGIAARPLSISYAARTGRSGIILGYSGANVHELREGMRKLATCL
ncbi:PLP-dependent aminotransferase family protein [Dyella caseinilytica]|uniref:PLP-dependent aminotransferase family protein n=1 Tax=Dyella caseinilytica TaxID=1849581 RepID=A0ABX7GPB7_9GAMM|nr:PLP-dependent aminotransferase family protein [Dyella caseinilytica]QRN52080.1 PLP-dependent aminotransferase family protein [Dyella caseinilytica]GGA15583.1 GntR family transcriptional regulator [Dyella caseinilytica]